MPLVVVGMVVSACGGDATDDTDSMLSTTAGTEAETVVSDQIETATDELVDRFGGQEAFALVVVSIDQGYTVSQILDGFTAMGADGVLEGVDPEGPAVNLVGSALESTGSGPPSDGTPRVQLVALAQELDEASGRHVEFVARTLAEIYAEATMSTLGRNADGELELAEGQMPYEREKTMVLGTLALLSRGYTLEQAITALVLGTAIGDANGGSCWFITDETPPGRDLVEEECGSVDDSHQALADLFPASETTSTSTPEGDDSSGSPLDGVYTAELPADSDGETLENKMELVIEDGVIVTLEWTYAVEGFSSETGAGGKILCVSDIVQTLTSTGTAPLSDGVGEVPAELVSSQTMGEPLTSEECDESLAGDLTFPLTARVTIDDGDSGVAVVELISEGETFGEIDLQR